MGSYTSPYSLLAVQYFWRKKHSQCYSIDVAGYSLAVHSWNKGMTWQAQASVLNFISQYKHHYRKYQSLNIHRIILVVLYSEWSVQTSVHRCVAMQSTQFPLEKTCHKLMWMIHCICWMQTKKKEWRRPGSEASNVVRPPIFWRQLTLKYVFPWPICKASPPNPNPNPFFFPLYCNTSLQNNMSLVEVHSLPLWREKERGWRGSLLWSKWFLK